VRTETRTETGAPAPLLGWTAYDEDGTWARLGPADDSRRREQSVGADLLGTHSGRAWPTAPQIQAHLDILVGDLDAASAFAECGSDVATPVRVSRQSVHASVTPYLAGGVSELANRPRSSPRQSAVG
jgi:hypothetical protein